MDEAVGVFEKLLSDGSLGVAEVSERGTEWLDEKAHGQLDVHWAAAFS